MVGQCAACLRQPHRANQCNAQHAMKPSPKQIRPHEAAKIIRSRPDSPIGHPQTNIDASSKEV